MKYFHTAISVANLEVSRSFYECVFGLKFRSQGENAALKYKFINLEGENNDVIELFEHESPLPLKEDLMDMQMVGIKHIAFIVDKIEPVIDRALTHGGKIIQPAKPGMTVKRKAFISDPDGIPIELVELNP